MSYEDDERKGFGVGILASYSIPMIPRDAVCWRHTWPSPHWCSSLSITQVLASSPPVNARRPMFPLHASALPTRTFLPKIVRRIPLRITLRREA
jgi:hypothetical protein